MSLWAAIMRYFRRQPTMHAQEVQIIDSARRVNSKWSEKLRLACAENVQQKDWLDHWVVQFQGQTRGQIASPDDRTLDG